MTGNMQLGLLEGGIEADSMIQISNARFPGKMKNDGLATEGNPQREEGSHSQSNNFRKLGSTVDLEDPASGVDNSTKVSTYLDRNTVLAVGVLVGLSLSLCLASGSWNLPVSRRRLHWLDGDGKRVKSELSRTLESKWKKSRSDPELTKYTRVESPNTAADTDFSEFEGVFEEKIRHPNKGKMGFLDRAATEIDLTPKAKATKDQVDMEIEWGVAALTEKQLVCKLYKELVAQFTGRSKNETPKWRHLRMKMVSEKRKREDRCHHAPKHRRQPDMSKAKNTAQNLQHKKEVETLENLIRNMGRVREILSEAGKRVPAGFFQ